MNVPTKCGVRGCGQAATAFNVVGDGFDAFTLNSGSTFRAASFTASGVTSPSGRRSSGSYITIASGGDHQIVEDFQMSLWFKGIVLNSTASSFISQGKFVNGFKDTGIALEIVSGNECFIKHLTIDNPADVQPGWGIIMRNGGRGVVVPHRRPALRLWHRILR